MLRRSPALSLVATAAGLLSLLLAWATGGLSASLINPDEGGHYVNALFLGDWLRAGLPPPLAYARDYYAHFPRLTSGTGRPVGICSKRRCSPRCAHHPRRRWRWPRS